MVPIEVLWIVLIILFGFIGMARGYPRELGVTTMSLIALLALNLLEPRLQRLETALESILRVNILSRPDINAINALIFSAVLLLITFAAYAGQTFYFPGSPRKGRVGSLISFTNGLVNGYLIVGSLWHYLDKFSYGVGAWTLVTLPLTPRAQSLLPYLPPAILDFPFLAGLVVVLMILRIRR